MSGGDLLWRLARVDLTPKEATDVLLGTPTPAPAWVPSAAWLSTDGGVAVSLSSESLVPAQQRLAFDAFGRVRSAKRFDQDGATIWSARFEDYREVGDEFFAFRIELEFPRVDANAKIVFKKVELNPALPADLFVLKLPGATR